MTDTDREQLELAAKAAGYWNKEFNCYEGPLNWDPRNDDGDAFRLAVKLHISVMQPAPKDRGNVLALWPHGNGVSESRSKDRLAATRRVIVRAAAEIGRNMK